VDKTYRELIRSSRVSKVTRGLLEARSKADDPDYLPQALDLPSFMTLRALLDRVIPQSPHRVVDLAARIDAQLAKGTGDGWRFSVLPADKDAYRIGLRTLNAGARTRFDGPFESLTAAQQDALLGDIAMDGDSRDFDGTQMKAWFADLRADAVRLYVTTPDVLAVIGYSGIANGGDGLPKSGFVAVGLDEREEWEPVPSADESK